MAFIRQTWTLTLKNLLVVFVRAWFSTTLRALLLPVVYMFFLSYMKNFFVPPARFGIGSPNPVRSLDDALRASARDKVVFVHNGFTGGDIENVINKMSDTVRNAGKAVTVVGSDVDLLTECRSTLRGASVCYGAASFHSSPSEGDQDFWNYTIRADGALGTRIYVDEVDNDAQIYLLPFQHAIDITISELNGSSFPSEINEYPYTSRTLEERARNIQRIFMDALINFLAVAFFIGVCGVTYHLTGHMASERELGMSQLIEAMLPNKRRWHTLAARLVSTHLAFDIVYLPGIIIMSIIQARLVFTVSSVLPILFFHILAGLALSSYSLLGASFFRKAQLSGITVVLVSLVLAIVAQVTKPTSVISVVILGLLFPPMTYTFFIIYTARFERVNRPVNLFDQAPDSPWEITGIVFWVFLIIQIFVYPALAAFVEQSLYGTASKNRSTDLNPEGNLAIKLSSFRKVYQASWFRRTVLAKLGFHSFDPVVAVDGLSLSALRGQILVMLGANGSGKSTTLNNICGLDSITDGAIDVDGTGGLGYCPQKNVLFDELTVYEHVWIFNRLKSTGPLDSKKQIKELIAACDLDLKTKAKSATLSGGQKRKLQLAMMFTGGSRVCCVDEVSSGLDPLSRRKIWDIILAERGARTMLLTTHFLDEADVLSDFIVVMSKGQLKADGSATELKHKFGGEYQVVVPLAHKNDLPTDLLAPHRVEGDKIVFSLATPPQVASFVQSLEDHGIFDVAVNSPTIEDVFLRLAEEIDSDLPDKETEVQSKSPEPASEDKEALEMSTGKGTSMLVQAWILFRKRVTILKRNYLPYVFALVLPIAAAGLVTFYLDGFNGLGCSPGDDSTIEEPIAFQDFIDQLDIVAGPTSRLDESPVFSSSLLGLLRLNDSLFHEVQSLDEFNKQIETRFANVTPGGAFVGASSSDVPLFAYKTDRFFGGAVLAQNILTNIVSEVQIFTSFTPFAIPFAPGAGDTLQLILYFGLAMSAYPGLFSLYPTRERLWKVRALHYSNGIRSAPLWLAYLMFDFVFVLIISAVTVGIFIGASDVWYYPGYLFVVFFLYGLTSILFAYVVSLFVTSQLAAFAFAAGGQCGFFLVYFIMYMSILTYVPAASVDGALRLAHFVFATITPAGNMLRALLLTLNEFSILCRGDSVASYPGEMEIYGGPVLYLIVQAAILFGFLVAWDSGWKPPIISKIFARKTRTRDNETNVHADVDVLAETTRAEASEDSLRALHLTKYFGKFTAVDDLTFGISKGEVFALLGPNGAGKSSTISLIRGDIRPSLNAGDVFIANHSIKSHRATARYHLGVCPQFDAMDNMTVTEQLLFYARARGVPEPQKNVAALLEAVGLQPYKNRIAFKLSGGNKRKLSLAIALTGNPAVLLLDEPSSGMDAAAKRVMWRTLLGVAAPGRALLCTTHSMEEADKLARRVGIMTRGRMVAVDTADKLRDRFDEGWGVHLSLKTAPETTKEEMDGLREWVERHIVGAEMEKLRGGIGHGTAGGGHGQLRFRVRDPRKAGQASPEANEFTSVKSAEGPFRETKESITIGQLFRILEDAKEELGLEYYSISPTTLDQVFLRVVGTEEEEKGDSGAK